MNTTNTVKVVAENQPDADSKPPSSAAQLVGLMAMGIQANPVPNMGLFIVYKQGSNSYLHTPNSSDILWKPNLSALTEQRESSKVLFVGIR